jgi:hypothetical protein
MRSVGRWTAVIAVIALSACASVAHAGQWMQVSCVNPDGSAAPSEGWVSDQQGLTALPGSDVVTAFAPSTPMSALLSAQAPTHVGSAVNLVYVPPTGSTLTGGSIDVALSADGYGYANADAEAGVYQGLAIDDSSDLIFSCVARSATPCQNGTDAFSGVIALPAGHTGDLFVHAGCTGTAGASCRIHAGAAGDWALAQVRWAHLLLSDDASPQATGIGGSALQPGVSGTGRLVFTATDAGGPGVYSVTVSLDGRPVWSGTPDANGGACAAVGADPASGALMFDHRQPCPQTVAVDVPVATAGLPDGPHELKAIIADAAGNVSPVLDQTITTSNPQLTPVPTGARAIHARFRISWRWDGPRTLLRAISVSGLPGTAEVALACRGRGCPRLRRRRARAGHVGRLLGELHGRTFRAGDRLLITVTEPGHRTERIALTIRENRIPAARLLAG